MCGVYLIENIIDNKKYIGFTSNNIKNRFSEHKSKLRKNEHSNKYLQRVWNKYGEEIFKFEIIQELERDMEILHDMEIYWIAYYNSYVLDGGGYNLTRGGEGTFGYCHTEEYKKNLSESMMGKSPANKGIPCSEEQKLKISIANKGNKAHLGHLHTEESKKKMSEAKIGKKSGMLGKQHTEESKQKMSQSLLGKPQSDESVQKNIIIRQGKKKKFKDSSTSKYVGVSFDKKLKNWMAYIGFNKKRIYLGRFINEEDAARAYNDKAIELYGENAKLNEVSND